MTILWRHALRFLAGMSELNNRPDIHWQRLTAVLVLATLISAFGSSFQYGYNVAVVNSPSLVNTPSLGPSTTPCTTQ